MNNFLMVWLIYIRSAEWTSVKNDVFDTSVI